MPGPDGKKGAGRFFRDPGLKNRRGSDSKMRLVSRGDPDAYNGGEEPRRRSRERRRSFEGNARRLGDGTPALFETNAPEHKHVLRGRRETDGFFFRLLFGFFCRASYTVVVFAVGILVGHRRNIIVFPYFFRSVVYSIQCVVC
ncbi:hypothetical protein GWI33_000266 [Rhynchophorus ferrugineus]|uniref:Transmembrane protein n=1 Tax=Rhynchophorus ferrugineus TaxID=354439 RepID=A0A834MPR9_RHYFE|nr:hypothetical protein GWI33_000266 [Rhynchophorus ferrugineus]